MISLYNCLIIPFICIFKHVSLCFTFASIVPPTIQSPQSTVYGVQGQIVQLNCTFNGLPIPTITWTSPNGSALISQSHFMVQSTNTSTSLTISPLGPSDSGTYTCTATNIIGVSSASIQLIFQSKNIIIMKELYKHC